VHLRETIRSRSPADLEFLDALAAQPGDPALALEQEGGRHYDGIPCLYIDEVRSARRRIDVLSRLPPSALKIFGGPDWAAKGSPLAKCYAGRPVRYGSDLSSIYFHSRINMNVFHAQCFDSTNSRVYDVLAAGGFLLTEDRPVLRREFEVGRHLVTFSTPDEARDMVAYYLGHPAEREAIAREGQRHVLARHKFSERCRRLLDLARPFIGRPESDDHAENSS
jgi:spore maturation protein CgeB